MQIRKVESKDYPDKVQYIQRKQLVNLGVEEHHKTNEEKEVVTWYVYDQVITEVGTDAEEVEAEYWYNKMKERLKSDGEIEINLNYIEDEDTRSVGTKGDWVAYRKACRDYATKTDNIYRLNNINGKVYTYQGKEYTVNLDEKGAPLPPFKI